MATKHEKFIEEIGNMTVLDLADLVKALEEKFGVSAAMAVAAAPAGAAEGAAVVEEKNAYKVVLQDAGSDKIKVIKALRTIIPNLALTEAKKITESTPYVVVESATKDDAAKMKKELEAAGAKVELS